jgi:hypothetical protein
MSSKIRIKVAHVEVEYEGSEEFLKDGLVDLLQSISDLYPAASAGSPSATNAGGGETAMARSEHQLEGSINTVAARLKVASGPELITAAIAHLQLVQGKETASRKEITTEMRKASAYFKQSYVGNMTANLQSLVKTSVLNEIGADTYSLTAATRAQIASTLSVAAS